MGDRHQVVVDHVGEVVGREAVRLQEHQVFQVGVLVDDLPAQQVDDARLPFQGRREADHEGLAGREVLLHLGGRKIPAMAVITRGLFAHPLLLPHPLQALGRAEAAVGVAVLDQVIRVLAIEAGALALGVGTVGATAVRPLVPGQAEPVQRVENTLGRVLDESLLVGVLDPQHEGAVLSLPPHLPVGEEPVEERRPATSDV